MLNSLYPAKRKTSSTMKKDISSITLIVLLFSTIPGQRDNLFSRNSFIAVSSSKFCSCSMLHCLTFSINKAKSLSFLFRWLSILLHSRICLSKNLVLSDLVVCVFIFFLSYFTLSSINCISSSSTLFLTFSLN